jgi:hypothetical protein
MHMPHDIVSPGLHAPMLSPHTLHAPKLQSASQKRSCTAHSPGQGRVSLVPGSHSPLQSLASELASPSLSVSPSELDPLVVAEALALEPSDAGPTNPLSSPLAQAAQARLEIAIHRRTDQS